MSLSIPGLSAAEEVEVGSAVPGHAAQDMDGQLGERVEEEVPRLSGK